MFVKNTYVALINIAEFSRNRFKGKTIGITGSNGKTTTVNILVEMCQSKNIRGSLSGNVGIPFSESVLEEIKYPDSKIVKEIIGEIIGFDRKEKSEACEFVSSITGDNSRNVVSFGTEAGLFQEIGISTVVCGPGSIEQAHTVDEYISYDQLKKCLKMLINLQKRIESK